MNEVAQIALKNILIKKLQKHIHLFKIESFINVLNYDYKLSLKDINNILIMNNIDCIIAYNILDSLVDFSENIYYTIDPINYNTFKKINAIFDDDSLCLYSEYDLKQLLLKHNIISYRLSGDDE